LPTQARRDPYNDNNVKTSASIERRHQDRSDCHSTFRAIRITAYLETGDTIENAQAIPAHESLLGPFKKNLALDSCSVS
jgi:hypothetical protein